MPEQAKPKSPAKPADKPAGERIAKVLSRAGVASRREAERMIEAGEVKVNGRVIDSPALNVTAQDRITVNGRPLAAKEPARLWLYYKPEGLVTSAADEKGRETVFDALPEDMPRVMSVGRLDLNSEGLLLLTNDGGLKRRLELPSTGWLRKYRVRVHGNPEDGDLEPLRQGIVVEGEKFQPMQVTLDRVQGSNAWLTVGLREGRNREVRRAMAAIGLTVNRLIRISYGPFRLNELQPGEVAEVKPRILRDQLGFDPDEGAEGAEAPASKPAKIRAPRAGAPGAKLARSAERYLDAVETGKPRKATAGRPERPVSRSAHDAETDPKPRGKPPAPTEGRPAKPGARLSRAEGGPGSRTRTGKPPAGGPAAERAAAKPVPRGTEVTPKPWGTAGKSARGAGSEQAPARPASRGAAGKPAGAPPGSAPARGPGSAPARGKPAPEGGRPGPRKPR